jgi:nitroimidazol reductase NimA-like FMN-containing flavoprotein (pyridoxamine 5'-phosphate oxidase superfamily)
MFRKMRRFKQALTEDEIEDVLYRCTSGVLACSGDDGYPYAVPLSYYYDGSDLYFHCAMEGHKIDAIRKDPKVSFCVIDKDEIMPSEFTTYFRSVIIFGKAEIIEDSAEKSDALSKIADKYSHDFSSRIPEAVSSSLSRANIVRIKIDHITGKEAKEIALKKNR